MIHDTVELPENVDGETDPGFGQPSLDDELIRRTAHDTEEYKKDNKLVWDALRHVLHGSQGWVWIKS